MSFVAVLLALLLEQIKPLPRNNVVHHSLASWVGWTGRNFDAGKPQHARVVWAVTVIAPALASALVYILVAHYSLIAALLFDVAILYLTLGFRQFSHYFTDIRTALESGDEPEARRLLAEWRNLDASELPRTELLRHMIEHSLLAAHRHVFGVFFCFIAFSTLGLGPAGAVLYRMAEFASRYWAFRGNSLEAPVNENLMALSQRLFSLIDHIPARLTAFGFAVVGNFQDAIDGWKRDAGLWKHANEGIILAAAAGAVGVQLGGGTTRDLAPDRARALVSGEAAAEFESAGSTTQGLPPQLGHLGIVVGLVWRSVLLWMLLVALLKIANLLSLVVL